MTYKAFETRDQHREALERLWAENMSDSRIAAVQAKRWKWLYESNPAGPALTYVVEHVESKQIVGSASVYPRDIILQGKPGKAGVLADFVTSKAHRVAGPAVMVQRAIANAHRERGFDFLFGYPNKGAAPIFPRLRFETVGESTLWVKPLRTRQKLATFIHPISAHLLAPLADSLLALNDLRLCVARRNRYRISLDRLPDQAFSDLWHRRKESIPVSGVRTAEYLTWRYVNHTTEHYHFFTLQSRHNATLHGYVVYLVRNNRVFIADAFADHGYAGLAALLLSFSRCMRRHSYESVCVNYAGDKGFLEVLRSLQFVERVGKRKLIAFVAKDQPSTLRKLVMDEASWFMHDGELDI